MPIFFMYPKATILLLLGLLAINFIRIVTGQATLLTGAAVGVELFYLWLLLRHLGWI